MAIMEGISPLNFMMDNTRELARKKWSGRVVKHRLELIESLLLMNKPDLNVVASGLAWSSTRFSDKTGFDDSGRTREQIEFSNRFILHFTKAERRKVEAMAHALNKPELNEKMLRHFKERKAEIEQYM